MTHPRPSLKMQASRKLGASLRGLNGTMHGSSNLRFRYMQTPETPVSGVFVYGRFISCVKEILPSYRPCIILRRQYSCRPRVRVPPG
jgi:hypothetical protein